MTPIQIGITGGIGSGKSMVARILQAMQYPVYDTDAQAKYLMDMPLMRERLKQTWGDGIFLPDGAINRPHLASIVFNNKEELDKLNSIVHPAVRSHYTEWVSQQKSPIVFVESAILHQAHMDKTLQYIWIVDADTETRIKRVMQRNNISRSEVEQRIASQREIPTDNRTHIIHNDYHQAILPQILKLINIATDK